MSIAAVILANKDPSMNVRFLHAPMGYQRIVYCTALCGTLRNRFSANAYIVAEFASLSNLDNV